MEPSTHGQGIDVVQGHIRKLEQELRITKEDLVESQEQISVQSAHLNLLASLLSQNVASSTDTINKIRNAVYGHQTAVQHSWLNAGDNRQVVKHNLDQLIASVDDHTKDWNVGIESIESQLKSAGIAINAVSPTTESMVSEVSSKVMLQVRSLASSIHVPEQQILGLIDAGTNTIHSLHDALDALRLSRIEMVRMANQFDSEKERMIRQQLHLAESFTKGDGNTANVIVNYQNRCKVAEDSLLQVNAAVDSFVATLEEKELLPEWAIAAFKETVADSIHRNVTPDNTYDIHIAQHAYASAITEETKAAIDDANRSRRSSPILQLQLHSLEQSCAALANKNRRQTHSQSAAAGTHHSITTDGGAPYTVTAQASQPGDSGSNPAHWTPAAEGAREGSKAQPSGIMEVQAQLVKLQDELDACHAKIDELLHEREALRASLAHRDAEVQQARDETRTARGIEQNAKEHVIFLEKQLLDAGALSTTLQTTLVEQSNALIATVAAKDSMAKDLENARFAAAAANTSISELREQLNEQADTIAALKRDVAIKDEALSHAQLGAASTRNLEKELEHALAAQSTLTAQMHAQVASYEAQIATLNGSLQAARASIESSADGKLGEALARISELEEESARLRLLVEHKSETAQRLQDELEKLQSKFQVALEEQADITQSAHAKDRQRIAELNADVASLQAKCADAEARAEELQATIDLLQMDLRGSSAGPAKPGHEGDFSISPSNGIPHDSSSREGVTLALQLQNAKDENRSLRRAEAGHIAELQELRSELKQAKEESSAVRHRVIGLDGSQTDSSWVPKQTATAPQLDYALKELEHSAAQLRLVTLQKTALAKELEQVYKAFQALEDQVHLERIKSKTLTETVLTLQAAVSQSSNRQFVQSVSSDVPGLVSSTSTPYAPLRTPTLPRSFSKAGALYPSYPVTPGPLSSNLDTSFASRLRTPAPADSLDVTSSHSFERAVLDSARRVGQTPTPAAVGLITRTASSSRLIPSSTQAAILNATVASHDARLAAKNVYQSSASRS